MICQPGLDGAGGVARGAVLHEQHLTASHLHAGLEVSLQDGLVHGRVHLGVVLHKIQPPKPPITIKIFRK